MVAELKDKTLGATFCPVQCQAPVKTLIDTCKGGGQDCSRDTKEVKVKELVHREAEPIRQLKGKTSKRYTGRLGGLETGGHAGETKNTGGS